MKKILFDADVLIHFSKGDALDVLPELFAGRMAVLEQVRGELHPSSDARAWVDTQIEQETIEYAELPASIDIIQEYATLTRRMGRGESACLVMARFDDRYLASSNIRDIQKYCNKHRIGFVTTMDVICMLEDSGIWSRTECNEFLTLVKQRKSRLPVKTLQEYRKRFKVRKV